MLLAAGRGERMRPLTDRVPKPLLEVAGERLIERHLRALRLAGVEEVVINVAWLGEQIRALLGDGAAYGMRIVWSPEPPGALDTGGGIRRALAWLGEGPFLVVNADVWIDLDVAAWLAGATWRDADHAELMLVATPPWKARHDFALSGRRIVAGPATHTFAGIGLYRAGLFAAAPAGAERFPLAPLLHGAAAAGRLAGRAYAGEWHDVGTPERLAALSRRLLAGG